MRWSPKKKRPPVLPPSEPSPKRRLPAEAFEVAAELYPLFIWSLEQTELDGSAFFVLSFLRRSAARHDGRPMRLHSQLTKTVQRVSGHDAGSSAELIARLQRRGLVQKLHSGLDRRKELADDPASERTMMVCLTDTGQERLNRFNDHVDSCIDELLDSAPTIKVKTIGFLIRRFQAHAPALAAAARKLSEKRWAEPDPAS